MSAERIPYDEATRPEDGRPPRHPADDLTRLADSLQQIQQMLAAHDDDPCWAPLQVTHEAVALAERLLHGWQVQQTLTQDCLTRWEHLVQALEPLGLLLPIQAETLWQATGPLRRAPWWAFLAGVGLMGLGALGAGRLPPLPHLVPPGPALRSLPLLPESLRPSEAPFRTMPDATPVPATDDTPTDEGP